MKKFKYYLLIGGLLILFAAVVLLIISRGEGDIINSDAIGGVTVSINATEVGPDTNFVVRVNITSVTNFDACNYDITYDPSVLAVTNVTSGLIGATTVPIDMWGEIVPGRLRVIENIPGVSGAIGSGYLAEVRFHVVGTYGSNSTVAFSNGIISTSSATEIIATWMGSSVTVYAVLAAGFSASPIEGIAGFTQFTFTDTTAGDMKPYTYRWDFDNNGIVDSTTANPTHTYTSAGTYTVSLTVTATGGSTDVETKTTYIKIYKQGDSNNDGKINCIDITKTERIIVQLDTTNPGADANLDNSINSLDVTKTELLILSN